MKTSQLRSLAQGLCRMTPVRFRDAVSCVRLWIHECERVFADRLISEADIAKFNELRMSATKKHFGALKQVSASSMLVSGCALADKSCSCPPGVSRVKVPAPTPQRGRAVKRLKFAV